jgi:hypothetical protein
VTPAGKETRVKNLLHALVLAAGLSMAAVACGGERIDVSAYLSMESDLPPPVPAWGGHRISTLCIDLVEDFPQLPDGLSDSPAEVIKPVVRKMEMEVVDLTESSEGSESCDALLRLELEGEALGERYRHVGAISGSTLMYTGGRLDGKLTLSSEGLRDLQFPIAGYDEVDEQTSAGGLTDPSGYDFRPFWFEPVMEAIRQIWGPPAMVWSLDQYEGAPLNVSAMNLRRLGPSEEVLGALLPAVTCGDGEFEFQSYQNVLRDFTDSEDEIRQLAEFGPGAMPAVPLLIGSLEDGPHQVRTAAWEALKQITGQSFGGEPSAWLEWWNEQPATQGRYWPR